MARRGIPDRRRPTVGLVLGAGGVVGQAYQAGVLAALEREAHWDARGATIIVGTSAGSVTGAALRVGVPATDLAASTYGRPTSPNSYYEAKYKDPLGIVFDLTHTGWIGAAKDVVAKEAVKEPVKDTA